MNACYYYDFYWEIQCSYWCNSVATCPGLIYLKHRIWISSNFKYFLPKKKLPIPKRFRVIKTLVLRLFLLIIKYPCQPPKIFSVDFFNISDMEIKKQLACQHLSTKKWLEKYSTVIANFSQINQNQFWLNSISQ